MRLDPKSENNLLSVIKFSQCKGQNIHSLASAKDVGDAFNIRRFPKLCSKIFSEITSFEVMAIENIDLGDDDDGKDEEEKAVELADEINGKFSINILSQGKLMVLNEKVTKYDTIEYVKILYKSQSGIDVNIQDIHFEYKTQVLTGEYTLEEVGIINNQHLISVKFETSSHRVYI